MIRFLATLLFSQILLGGFLLSNSLFAITKPAQLNLDKTPSLNISKLKITTIAAKLNNTSLTSFENKPIVLLENQVKNPLFKIYLQAGLHGNEKLPSRFVFWLAKRLSQNIGPLAALRNQNIAIDMVPVANPDGMQQTLRSNTNLTNLNRNFPVFWGITKEYPGKFPLSEKETQAISHLFETNKYDLAIDLHGYVPWIVLPSQKIPTKISDGNIKLSKLKDWNNTISAIQKDLLPQYQVKTALQLGDGGSFEDWAFWEHGALAASLEFDSAFRYKNHNNQKEDQFLMMENLLEKIIFNALSQKNNQEVALQP